MVSTDRCQREHEYVTLKVYETGNRQGANEITVLQHLRSLLQRDKGNRLVRSFIDSFEVSGPVGPHTCLTHKPLCLSPKELRRCAGGQLHHSLLKPLIYGVLCGLAYLHRGANIVHTGETASCSNKCLRCSWYLFNSLQTCSLAILCSPLMRNRSGTTLFKKNGQTRPPRKVVKNRVIYASRSPDIPGDGRPIICDFGEAKVGPGPFIGELMPDRYRAPEIILYIPWTRQIDIWSMGLLFSSLWGLSKSLIRTPNECSPVFENLGSSRRSASLQLSSNEQRGEQGCAHHTNCSPTWGPASRLFAQEQRVL